VNLRGYADGDPVQATDALAGSLHALDLNCPLNERCPV
jgi:hypothetical protein